MIHGNGLIQELLKKAVDNGRLHHALLFHGPEGVGKYSTAMELIQRLNCESQNIKPCGQCSCCNRLSLPFPFHPDVQLFRESTTPLFLNRRTVFRQFLKENKLSDLEVSSLYVKEYEDTLTDLQAKGFLQQYAPFKKASPPIDMIRFPVSVELNQTQADKYNTGMMARWIVKKLHTYTSSHTYNRSIQIDAVRLMQKNLYLHTFEGRFKAVVMDDADKMLPAAQNCLLKTLEEPPGESIIILIVTNPTGLLSTIRSRCQPIPFKRLTQKEIQETLIEELGFAREQAHQFAPMSHGSISRILATDWELQSHQQQQLAALFDAGSRDVPGWVTEVAQTVIQMTDSQGNDGPTIFYQYLHNRLCLEPDSAVLAGALPGGKALDIDSVIFLLDGLVHIRNHSMYHIDLQLNLETLLIQMLDRTERI